MSLPFIETVDLKNDILILNIIDVDCDMIKLLRRLIMQGFKIIKGTNVIEMENPILSMACIGEFHCGKLFKVCVYTGERNIPHFHVIKTQTGEECCPRIDCANYFVHDGKDYQLNAKERKLLVNFLTSVSPYEEDYGKTYFDLIWEEWNRNNRQYRIVKPESMPDYNNL